MAYVGKTEITIGVAVGSSIQIGAGALPLLVILGWIISQDLTLFFGVSGTLFLSMNLTRKLRRGKFSSLLDIY